jgi:hypothetical protein
MSVAFNTAQVIGPAFAAVLIEWIGEGPVFVLNGFAYSAVVLAAVVMRVQGRPEARGSGSILANVLDGLHYIRRTPELCWLVISMAILSLLARPFGQLMPVFARDVLDVGAAGLGALNSAAGAGALAGAVLTAALGSYRGRGLALMLSAAGFGLLLVAFGLSTSFTLSLVISGAIGLLSAFSGINTNTMLQLHADHRMRGRVISLHGLTMMGVVPLGVMLEGALGSIVGVPTVVIVAGFAAMLVVVYTMVAAPRSGRWRRWPCSPLHRGGEGEPDGLRPLPLGEGWGEGSLPTALRGGGQGRGSYQPMSMVPPRKRTRS